MPGADLGPISMPRQVADLQAQLRRVRAGMTGGGFDPNADPVIIGAGATAAGPTYDVVVGAVASATAGGYNTAIGAGAVTLGQGTAVGINTYAEFNATAVGSFASTAGSTGLAVAVGTSSEASGYRTVAAGSSATASADMSVAIGVNASAGDGSGGTSSLAFGAVALGPYSTASHASAVAIGKSAATTKAHQIMLGTSTEFAEIPGSGLVLTDTASGTRHLVQITSGALVLNAAP